MAYRHSDTYPVPTLNYNRRTYGMGAEGGTPLPPCYFNMPPWYAPQIPVINNEGQTITVSGSTAILSGAVTHTNEYRMFVYEFWVCAKKINADDPDVDIKPFIYKDGSVIEVNPGITVTSDELAYYNSTFVTRNYYEDGEHRYSYTSNYWESIGVMYIIPNNPVEIGFRSGGTDLWIHADLSNNFDNPSPPDDLTHLPEKGYSCSFVSVYGPEIWHTKWKLRCDERTGTTHLHNLDEAHFRNVHVNPKDPVRGWFNDLQAEWRDPNGT